MTGVDRRSPGFGLTLDGLGLGLDLRPRFNTFFESCVPATARRTRPRFRHCSSRRRASAAATDRSSSSGTRGAAATAWLLGYLTAFNHYQAMPRRDVSGGKSTEELTAWIDGYCRDNPSNDVYQASIALVQAFLENGR